MDEKLLQIAEVLLKGEQSPAITTRDFLRLVNAQRRGYYIVEDIKAGLKKTGLKTVPNF